MSRMFGPTRQCGIVVSSLDRALDCSAVCCGRAPSPTAAFPTGVDAAALLILAVLWLPIPLHAQTEASPASYRVTFEGTWTTAATPGGLPSSAHFSTLIGATHNGDVIFWEAGAMASPGVESVAELGTTGTFKREISASEHALATVERRLPGGGTPIASVDFEVTAAHPLVTLLTMIAPSPDWFVGVTGLSLLDDAGHWRERLEVDLFPYDAGTEDGEEFSLSNPATVPRGVITSIRGMGKFTDEPMAKLTFVCQSGCDPPLPASLVRVVPLFPPATDAPGRQGLVRVINRSGEVAEVEIVAIDDMGLHSEPVTLSIAGGETAQFNSEDLETGNAGKGLSGSTGAREGDARLNLTTGLEVDVLSYIRYSDGFLTAMHDTVQSEGGDYWVAIFNPGRNTNQQSLLRLINFGTEEAAIEVEGIDDDGNTSGMVRLTLPAGGAGMVSAARLEANESRNDPDRLGGPVALEGELGNGAGKWQLTVRSDQPLGVMSLLESPTGHLTNLSTAPSRSGGTE